MRFLGCFILLAAAAGCSSQNEKYLTPQRLERGLVIILPGIEGESPMNRDIRQGLINAGVEHALPIYRWGRPVPVAGVLLNQMDFLGNRMQAAKIAQMIVQYQDSFPGRPVHLVGHSGGGGMAVFATEALPPGRTVDGLVLLSASINRNYDLSKALSKTRNGIVNFHNPQDAALLAVGTTIVGNVDGSHGPSAGLSGFSDEATSRTPSRNLYQVDVSDMVAFGDPHASTTKSSFVSSHVAPWVYRNVWPAMAARTAPLSTFYSGYAKSN